MPLSKLCRLCARDSRTSVNLFHRCEDDYTVLADLVDKYLLIKVNENDGLPSKICIRCQQTLKSFHCFYLLCQRSDFNFKNIIKSNQYMSIKEEHLNITDCAYFAIKNMKSIKKEKIKAEHKYDCDATESFDTERFGLLQDELHDTMSPESYEIIDTPKLLTSRLSCTSTKTLNIKLKRDRKKKSCIKNHPVQCDVKIEEVVEFNNQNCNTRNDTCKETYLRAESIERNNAIEEKPRGGVPEYICCICGARFSTSNSLRIHEKKHGPLNKRIFWSCSCCGKNFSSKGALGNHMKIVHEKLRPYICDLCGRTVSTRGGLEEHYLSHSEEKNFECDKCAKKFKTKGALKRHLDTHQGTSYQCPKCPKLLNSRRTLRNHLFVHDSIANHQCQHCDKKFKRRKNLKSHLKMHTGERPYVCEWCHRSFTNSSNCRLHQKRIHHTMYSKCHTENTTTAADAM